MIRGDIISFRYIGQRPGHPIGDPNPLVLVSDNYRDAIRGVNLNYLVFPTVRELILNYLGKNFSYQALKTSENYTYIVKNVKAFRTYKKVGISNQRILDTNFLIGLATVARSMDQFEVQQIQQQIEQIISAANRQGVAGPGTIPTNI